MAEYHRGRVREGPVDHTQIGVANANGNGAHQDFARAGFTDSHFFDSQWRTWCVEHGSFHVFILDGCLRKVSFGERIRQAMW
ncbi:hypothetical protein D9M71_548680 [compost metagenome]